MAIFDSYMLNYHKVYVFGPVACSQLVSTHATDVFKNQSVDLSNSTAKSEASNSQIVRLVVPQSQHSQHLVFGRSDMWILKSKCLGIHTTDLFKLPIDPPYMSYPQWLTVCHGSHGPVEMTRVFINKCWCSIVMLVYWRVNGLGINTDRSVTF